MGASSARCGQAIFALHRGDVTGASKQLDAAGRLASALLAEECTAMPALRQQGAVGGMLEELAEAALFDAWLRQSGTLLPRSAVVGGVLTPAEYLGGICDLVGEVGRYAVRRATERDAAAVREALATAMAVHSAMLSLGGVLPRGTHKKLETLKQAVRKLETLLYELSLVERSGRARAEPAEPLPEAPSMDVEDA